MESIALLDPYAILGLPRGCDESDVRRRYLELVRQFPPDRAPERFAEIRGAYESLRDPVVRLAVEVVRSGVERIDRRPNERRAAAGADRSAAHVDPALPGRITATLAERQSPRKNTCNPGRTAITMSNGSLENQTTIDRFRQWLEEAVLRPMSLPDEEDPLEQGDDPKVGLLQLIEEFTAVRHEVKLQTKSSRGLAERTEQALAAMQQAAELFRSAGSKEPAADR